MSLTPAASSPVDPQALFGAIGIAPIAVVLLLQFLRGETACAKA